MKKYLSIFIGTFLLFSSQVFAANPSVTTAVLSSNGRNITVSLTATLNTFSPGSEIGNFTVTVNGTSIAISGLSQPTDKSTFVINLGKVVNYGDVVLLSYLGGNIVDKSNNPLVAFTNVNVTNGTSIPGVNGYIENFNDNILTGWGNDKNNDFTFSESNQVLNVSANYTLAGYNPFSYTIPVNVNITSSPTVTFTLQTTAALDIRVDVQDSKGFTTNNTAVVKTGLTSGTYTYTFSDFTELYDSLGNKRTSAVSVDKTTIKRVLIYTNPGAGYSGSFSFDNLIIGTVPISVTGLTLTPSTIALNVGSNAALTATIAPATATNKIVTWTSSDVTIASVASNGVVTGIANGIVTITATSSDNATYLATSTVTVSGGTVTVDKTTLQAEIATATTTKNAAVAGIQNGQYAQKDIDAFVQALNNAIAVNTDVAATQTTVNTILTALQSAETVFASKKISVDRTALQSLLSTAETQSSQAVIGTSNGQYSQGAADSLSTAIINANTVLNTSTSQTEINAMVVTLQAAMDLFSSKVISITVTKTALLSKIASATQIKTAAVVGTHVGEYTQANLDIFTTAIVNAQSLYDNTSATQLTVNAMVTTLQVAIATFTATAVPTPNKTALANALAAATSEVNSALVGNLVGQYPQAAVDAYKAVLAIANAVNVSTTANQAEVDLQTANVTAAKIQFGLSINTTQTNFTILNTTIDSANALKNNTSVGTAIGNVSNVTMVALTSAIATAVSVQTNSLATQLEVNSAAATLATSIQAFKAAIIQSATFITNEEVVSVKAMPIPFNDRLTIQSKSEIIKRISVYTINGTIQFDETVNATSFSFQTNELPKGIYFVSVELLTGELKQLKLVK